jgi:hypothetical protein
MDWLAGEGRMSGVETAPILFAFLELWLRSFARGDNSTFREE